jgi:photosystem II stability/assembly factor-like uncharacterized protein
MRWLVVLALAGCQSRTELMVGVVTELRAPDLLDEVRLEVDNNLVPVNLGTTDWEIGNGEVGTFVLPGSYGLNSSDGSEPPVQITITGFKSGNKVVVRTARTSLVGGKTLFMRMGLVVGCMGNFGCGDGQSCIDGACKDDTVDSHTLPEYRVELVDHITCATGDQFISTKDNSALPTLGDMQCSGACVEGTCYNPPPDAGTPGQLWTPQPTPATAAMAQLNGIWGTTSSGYDVFAVGQRSDSTGIVLHLSGALPAAATGWVEEQLPAGTPGLTGVSGSSAQDVWAVGSNSTILHRTSGAWTLTNNPQVQAGLDLRAISLDSPSEGWIVGDNPMMSGMGGGLFWNGTQWSGNTQFNPKPTVPFSSVGLMHGLGLAAGPAATVYGWSASQGSWMGFGAIPQLMSANLFGVAGDGQYGYVCGQTGTIARLLAGGVGTPTFESLSQKGADLFAIYAAAPGNIYAAGVGGTILHATDGRSFMTEPSTFTGDLHAVWAANASDVYVVGQSGMVLHSTGTGSSGGTHAGADMNAMTPCPAGQTLCSDGCHDTNTDPNNCAGCGNRCAATEMCQGGCVPLGAADFGVSDMDASAGCALLGTGCANNTDCCSAYCNGTCQQASFCSQLGESCTSGTQCCSGVCQGTCVALVVGGVPMCQVDGESCMGSCGSCCSGLCKASASGPTYCATAPTCQSLGGKCQQNSDCCGGLLDGGSQGSVTCILAGGQTVGRCSTPQTCLPSGETCHTAAAMCPTNAPANCCSGIGMCVAGVDGVGRCN